MAYKVAKNNGDWKIMDMTMTDKLLTEYKGNVCRIVLISLR